MGEVDGGVGIVGAEGEGGGEGELAGGKGRGGAGGEEGKQGEEEDWVHVWRCLDAAVG